MAAASSGAIVAVAAVRSGGPTKPDPYAVPPALLARLTGKDPTAATESSQDVVSRIVSGSKWEFRGTRLLKVFEDNDAVAWLDPEGWTDCVVLIAPRAMPGLRAVFPDELPAGSLGSTAVALQHVSRGVRLGAAELWGIPAAEIGITVTMSCGAPAGGYFPRPVLVVSPRRSGDNHLRSAQAALAMGSGKGSARALRRRLADPISLEALPAALPAAQAAAVLLFATRAASSGRSSVRILQFDSAGQIRCMDNRCARSAGLQAKAPFDGPAIVGALSARAAWQEACNQQWELVLCDDNGFRRRAAGEAAIEAHAAATQALVHETAGMSNDDRLAVLSRHGISAAHATGADVGAGLGKSDGAAREPEANGCSPAGMGLPSAWPHASAAPLFVTIRNPKTGFDVVAEGRRHGFVMPGARLRLMRTSHGEAAARPLRVQVVPVRSRASHLAGGVHLRVPFLFEGEAGGGTLLEERMGAPGAQSAALRVSACRGVASDGDETTPEHLAGADGAVSITGDVRQRWLFVTAETMPPAAKSGSAPSELVLQPWLGTPAETVGAGLEPHRDAPLAVGREENLRRQTFFLAPFSHPLHPRVVPKGRGSPGIVAAAEAASAALESVWESESKALVPTKAGRGRPAPAATISLHRPILSPPRALAAAPRGPQPGAGPTASPQARARGSSAAIRDAARREVSFRR